MPNAVSFQGRETANLLFTGTSTFPNIVLFHGHISHLLQSPETEDGALACPAFHRKKSTLGCKGCFTSEHLRLGNEVFPPDHISECPSCLGSPEQPRNAAAAFKERHVRPWQSLLRGSIWLQLPTLECRAAIFGAEGSRRRTNRTLFTH